MKRLIYFAMAVIMTVSMVLSVSAAVTNENEIIVWNMGDAVMYTPELTGMFYNDVASCSVAIADGMYSVTKTAALCIAAVSNAGAYTAENQVDVDLDSYKYFGAVYKASGVTSAEFQFYYWTDVRAADGSELIRIPINADGNLQYFVSDNTSNMYWTDRMNTLRMDILSAEASGNVGIEYFAFAKTKDELENYIKNRSFKSEDPTPAAHSYDDAIIFGDDFIAFKMGNEDLMKDFFNRDPSGCITKVGNNVWNIKEDNEALGGGNGWGTADIAENMDWVGVNLDDYPFAGIRYKTGKMESGEIGFIYWTDLRDATGEEWASFMLDCDGNWNTEIIDMSESLYWTGNVKHLRVDFRAPNGSDVDVDYIIFAKNADAIRNFSGEAGNTGTSDYFTSAAVAVIAFLGCAAMSLGKKHK